MEILDLPEMSSNRYKETLKLVKMINQSGKLMHYYNSNQIERMKVEKNEFL